MSTFVDTSAMMALLNAEDAQHDRADATWRALLAADEEMVCSGHALLETFALVQSRLGMDAVRDLQANVRPALEIEWVTAEIHEEAVAALLAADRRQLSLVDCTSFVVMRRLGIGRAFAFDPHFADQGFDLVPDPA